ncbi:MAG: PE-PGRS family protein [Tunicatimonas sp.]
MRLAVLIFFVPLLGALGCTTDPSGYTSDTAPFGAPQPLGRVNDPQLSEVSGLVASRKNPGALWVHNDSGNPATLLLISDGGTLLATYHLHGAENRDWEDIAIGPGPVPGETYLYVGDIGDNFSLRRSHCVYRVIEPQHDAAAERTVDTIRQVAKLNFTYPQGATDAETLLLDPVGPTLYVLTKETDRIRVYTLQTGEHQQTAQLIATHSYRGDNLLDRLVAGDMSADGTEVLLKTYEYVFYWRRTDATVPIPDLLATPADTLPYFVEPQGEAVGFAADGSGYYTLSEENLGADVHLFFYPRSLEDSTQAIR